MATGNAGTAVISWHGHIMLCLLAMKFPVPITVVKQEYP